MLRKKYNDNDCKIRTRFFREGVIILEIKDTEKLVLARYDESGNLVPVSESESRWIKVFSSTWEHKDKQGKWLFSSREEDVLPPESKEPDAVIIVAVYNKRYIVLTDEFRVPIKGREISFPAGLIEKGEAVEDAAKREFFEETGLDLDVKMKSSPKLYSSAGCTNETVQIVFGEATGELSSTNHEAGEDINIIVANYDYVCQLCDSQHMPIGAKAWPILYMLKCMFTETKEFSFQQEG